MYAPAVALRVGLLAAHIFRTCVLGISWLFHSKEHTNFTYNLTQRNEAHLAWFIAQTLGVELTRVEECFNELRSDFLLESEIQEKVQQSPKRFITDDDVRYGRRLGWYAIVRLTQPNVIIESGTDKGLGSSVLAAALARNGFGRLYTLDINPAAGQLIPDRYNSIVEIVIGDAVESIESLGEQTVDLFIQDGNHTSGYEEAELAALTAGITPATIIVSDNSDKTDVLMDWAKQNGRTFCYWQEQPRDHWLPGGGIGMAVSKPDVRIVSSAPAGT